MVATTLARAMTLGSGVLSNTVMSLTAATGATNKMIAMVDNEVVRITGVDLTPTLSIVPGYTKSTAGPHAAGAPVIFGVPRDFVGIGGAQSLSFGPAGAITGQGGAGTIPVVDTRVFIGAGAGAAVAYTLALPAADQTNTIDIFNVTAFAHTVTLTGNPGTSDVATFVAALGGRLTLRANFGVWSIAGVQGVVVA